MGPSDPFTRFLTSKSHFSRRDEAVRTRAFLPRGEDHAVSVFGTEGLTPDGVWNLADLWLSEVRRIFGRGDFRVHDVELAGLRLLRDDVPDRHANIVDWPEGKDDRIALAQELADAAVLVIRT
jgi:hypothetical protein